MYSFWIWHFDRHKPYTLTSKWTINCLVLLAVWKLGRSQGHWGVSHWIKHYASELKMLCCVIMGAFYFSCFVANIYAFQHCQQRLSRLSGLILLLELERSTKNGLYQIRNFTSPGSTNPVVDPLVTNGNAMSNLDGPPNDMPPHSGPAVPAINTLCCGWCLRRSLPPPLCALRTMLTLVARSRTAWLSMNSDAVVCHPQRVPSWC